MSSQKIAGLPAMVLAIVESVRILPAAVQEEVVEETLRRMANRCPRLYDAIAAAYRESPAEMSGDLAYDAGEEVGYRYPDEIVEAAEILGEVIATAGQAAGIVARA